MTQKPIVEVQDLWYRYENQDWALRGVNLNISPGEFVAIIGQNGAGKTTLVKHFNGILSPAKGRMMINGRETQEIPFEEMATQVGYCYQNPDHQIFNLTVKDELEFGLRKRHLPEEEIHERIQKVLEIVNLKGSEQEYPFALSRGQRQKLAVGTILAMNPSLMIIDEPTTGMDWKGGETMMDLIRDLHRTGRTIVMITHDMRIVAGYASRVIVMVNGQIIADGTPKEVFVQTQVLKKAFLEAPQITRIAQALTAYGIPPDILTIEEAVEVFTRKINKAKSDVNAI
jgi:energy-coupling factor transporter ATP-binding protein EcfA2